MVNSPPPSPNRNPPPQVVNRMPTHEVIAQLRKYDGKKDAQEFMSRFKYDVLSYGLTTEWALRNFDRLLEGDAAAWWVSKWHAVSQELDACQNQGQIGDLFRRTEQEFYEIFDHSAQESTYRQRNKALTFTLGEDPTEYVTRKLELLRHIDANMSESKKITQIIKGLQYSLRQNMVLQTINSVHELLTKLRRVSEVHEEQKSRERKLFETKPNSYRSFSKPLYSSVVSGDNRNSGHTLNEVVPKNRQQAGHAYIKGKNVRSPDGAPVCNYCHFAGHVVKNCIELQERDKRRGVTRNFNAAPVADHSYQNRRNDSRNFNQSGQNANVHGLQDARYYDNNQSSPVFHTVGHCPNNETVAQKN